MINNLYNSETSFAAPYKTRMQVMLRRGARYLWQVVRYLLVCGISFIILYPLLVKLSVSFMTLEDLSDPTVKWIPKTVTLDNFRNAIEGVHFWLALKNTALLTIITTLFQLIICSAAAYGLTKYPYPGSRIVFALIIFTVIVPPSTYISAWYMQFRHFDPFGLTTLITGNDSVINSFIPFLLRALTGQGLKNGLFIYLMVQYFRNMPHELEEAAKVDGAGALKTFIRIALPNSRPILLTVAVLSVVWQWNDDFFPSFLAPNLDFLTTNVSNIELMLFGSDAAASFAKDPPILSAAKNAAALLLSFPLILFFAVIQRFFTDSLERSGIVG